MASAISLQLGFKDAAWFTTNATRVLLSGQIVYRSTDGKYKIGDGTTILSSLTFYGGIGGGLNMLTFQNTNVSHTGTTAETLIYSTLISANTVGANDIFEFFIRASLINSVNSKTIRVYFNTTNNLSGTPIKLYDQSQTNNAVYTGIWRSLISKNSQTSQEIMSNAAGTVTDINSVLNGFTTTAIDFTINQYFIITFQLASASESMTLRSTQNYLKQA